MPERLLYILPIKHAPLESRPSCTLALAEASLPPLAIAPRGQGVVPHLYRGINQFLDTLQLAQPNQRFDQFRVYQDGYIGTEDIAGTIKAAGEGEPNMVALRRLLSLGAQLEVTENPILVGQNAAVLEQATALLLATQDREKTAAEEELYQKLLRKSLNLIKQRDDSIAARVAKTLHLDETGLIFIGAVHDLVPPLRKRNIRGVIPATIFRYLTPTDLEDHPTFVGLKERSEEI